MTTSHSTEKRVLAIDPASRGFGFAVLEGPAHLIDWGVIESRKRKKQRTLVQVARLMQLYHPDVLVLEDCLGRGSRRAPRIQELIGALQSLAVRRGIPVRHFSPAEVKAVICHSATRTKREVATAIAQRLPELAQRLPRPRLPWTSEDSRTNIFDSVALGVAYFDGRVRRRRGGALGNVEA